MNLPYAMLIIAYYGGPVAPDKLVKGWKCSLVQAREQLEKYAAQGWLKEYSNGTFGFPDKRRRAHEA